MAAAFAQVRSGPLSTGARPAACLLRRLSGRCLLLPPAMTRFRWLGIALCVLAALGSAGAPREEEFVLIVNRSNQFDSLNRAKIAFLFLRKVSRWPWGPEAEPIDLGPPTHARRGFSKQG